MCVGATEQALHPGRSTHSRRWAGTAAEREGTHKSLHTYACPTPEKNSIRQVCGGVVVGVVGKVWWGKISHPVGRWGWCGTTMGQFPTTRHTRARQEGQGREGKALMIYVL